MIKNKILFVLAIVLTTSMAAIAQDFQKPTMSFSRKKPMYVTLTDGTEVSGTLKKFKYEKSLIEELVIVDSVSGKKTKITPDEIAFMYVMPSGLDKLQKIMDFTEDATQWMNPSLDKDIINKGYIYFEQSEVVLKKNKTETLLMQLLNPTFSSYIKVYHDPRAKETMTASVGGVKVAGGDAKSYYIKKGDAPAAKVLKKEYAEQFSNLYSDCDAVKSKYNSNIKWTSLNEHIVEYTKAKN